ncbi:hypothetical protein BS47DRAFT_1301562 [Hydnum rufescens UP504]|uniref:JmjC domain-containing protein n=1 Tax=Hydnum rufescens UP504 TaxID=1448309 RepID=A0A9P6DNU8_9AGAM|nr:hypothetical protein BS47DRAFT_1301562 [Hydnum rufescens UP504]
MDLKGSSSNRLSAADWTLKSILSLGKPLKRVHRVSASLPKDELLAIIQKFEYQGLPLVIEGWHQYPSWSANVLNPDWLANKYTEPLPVCNVYSMEDKRMPIAELLSKYSAGKEYARPEGLIDSERWYGKHLPFPPEWDEQLRILPSEVLPLGVGDTFPYTDRKVTVCYLGVGDTYTPAHKDSSASTGQNLMLGDILDSGKTSSFWFLTSSGDSDAASEWFRRSLHQDLDLGSHTITLDEFKTANFPIYVCQQKLGDMVIIPRMSCHQVVNHGGISLKVAWSRMSIFSLEAALLYELPVYHR